MTDRDKSILEYSEKMCCYCCNFDKEHIGMDGMALCKLTMTLAYVEDYGGNCMFYNVPKEQIIVPPCKVGDTVYVIYNNKIIKGKVDSFDVVIEENETSYVAGVKFFDQIAMIKGFSFGLNVFLTKEEAEKGTCDRHKCR